MKKFSLLFIACTFLLLAACGGKQSVEPSASPTPRPSEDALAASASPSPASDEETDNAIVEEDGDFYFDEEGNVHFNIEVDGGSVDVDPQDTAGFLTAVSFNDTDRMQAYIDAGTHIDVFDEIGFDALTNALISRSMDAAQLLIDNGVHINIQNEENYTPLIHLSERGDIDEVRFLLENGADPNIGGGDNHDYYPIIAAAFVNYYEVVGLLLEHGAYPNLEFLSDGETVTAASIAERYGFTKIADLLKN